MLVELGWLDSLDRRGAKVWENRGPTTKLKSITSKKKKKLFGPGVGSVPVNP